MYDKFPGLLYEKIKLFIKFTRIEPFFINPGIIV
jgi:hypothetical protein